MDADQVVPPPGFKLDKPQAQATPEVQPPPGFTLDTAPEGPPEAKDMPGTVAFGARQRGIVNAPKATAPMLPSSTGKGIVTNVGQHFNPITLFEGMNRMIEDPAAALMADKAQRDRVEQEAGESLVQGNTTKGIAKHVLSSVPLLGVPLNEIGNQYESGDKAGAVANAAGLVASTIGPAFLGDIPLMSESRGRGIARGQYGKSLALPAERSPAATARNARIVETGVSQGLPLVRSGAVKLRGMIEDLNEKIKGEIATDPNRPIGVERSLANTRELEKGGKFAEQAVPSSDLAAIRKAREDFLTAERPGGPLLPEKPPPYPELYDASGNKIEGPPEPPQVPRTMTAEEAQKVKQGTYKSLGERAYQRGITRTPETAGEAAEKALARGLKDNIAEAFPGVGPANAMESALLELEPAFLSRVSQLSKQSKFGIVPAAMGAFVKGITHSNVLAGAAGFVKAFYTPAMQSRVATALYKASKGGLTLPLAKARVAAYVNGLSQLVADSGDQPPESPTSP